jgi:tetratricopeptide (TPR) repeat protein
LFERGQFAIANGLLETAQKACSDSQSETLASILFGLAALRGECNRPQEAVALCSKSLSLRESVLTPGHPTLGHTYFSMAILRMEVGEVALALRMLSEALTSVDSNGKGDENAISRTHQNMSHCYLRLNDSARAAQHIEAAYKAYPEIPSCGAESNSYAE